MAVNSKRTGLLVMLVPILMLLGVGGYIVWKNLGNYETNVESMKETMQIRQLSKIEDALNNELLCDEVQEDPSVQCTEYRTNTDRLIRRSVSSDLSGTYLTRLFPLLDLLKPDRAHPHHTQYDLSAFQQKLQVLRQKIAKGKMDKKLLISGETYRSLTEPVEQYLQSAKLVSGSAMEQNSLQFQKEIKKSRYNGQLENMLVSYYLSAHKPISDDMLKVWDNYMASVSVPDAENIGEVGEIKSALKSLLQSKTFQKAKSDIEDARIDIIASHATGDYDISFGQWEKLYKTLDHTEKKAETMITESIVSRIGTALHESEKWFWMGIVLMLLSLLFVVLLVRYYLRAKEEDVALEQVVSNIQELSFDENEGKRSDLPPMPKNLGDRKAVYAYLESLLKVLHQKEQEAKEANEAKSQFLANMSHELRTPLNGIVGFTQILKDTNLDTDQREFVGIIESSSNNLLDIINDILDISKISAEKMELENIEFDLFDTVESVIDMLTARAEQKDIVLGVYIDPALAAKRRGDPMKIKQVLTNLVGNAIKFTPTYGSVSVLVEADETNVDQVKFSVIDTGIGISKEDQEKIFEAFTQVDASMNRKFGGTGLGLALSSQMVTLMGGELSVESLQGSGSTFFFTIALPHIEDEAKDDIQYMQSYKVGLALPNRNIHRDIDIFREKYCRYLGHSVEYYYYDDIFGDEANVILPDVMIFDHHYARYDGELDKIASLSCKKILITKPSLQNRLHAKEESFDAIAIAPMTFRKMQKAFGLLDKKIAKHNDNMSNLFSVDSDLQGKYALVAEDNPVNQKLIMNLLQKFGMHVKVVENGEEAVNAFKTNTFDIVFMDIQMPILGGVEATEEIKNYENEQGTKQHIPVIALTANALSGDKERYIKAGMDDYLPKPIIVEQLSKILQKYFDKKDDIVKPDEKSIYESDLTDQNDHIVIKDYHSSKGEVDEKVMSIIEEANKSKYETEEPSSDILLFRMSSLSRSIYTKILERLGYTVENVSSEDDMLDALDHQRYRYVLYDLEPFEKIDEMLQDMIIDSGAKPVAFSSEIKDVVEKKGVYLSMDVSGEVLKRVLENI